MTIQLSAIRALESGPVRAWLEYPYIDGLELEIEFATADETDALYGTQPDGKTREVSDEEFRDWHLARVKNWRGVQDGEAPAPLDRKALEVIWTKDGRFRTWLVGRCRHLGSFLGGPDPAAALALGASGDGAAA